VESKDVEKTWRDTPGACSTSNTSRLRSNVRYGVVAPAPSSATTAAPQRVPGKNSSPLTTIDVVSPPTVRHSSQFEASPSRSRESGSVKKKVLYSPESVRKKRTW